MKLFIYGIYISLCVLFLGILIYNKLTILESLAVTGICAVVLYITISFSFTDILIKDLLYIHGIDKIFDDINGYTLSPVKYLKHSTTYGEVSATGIKTMYEFVKDMGIDTFIDMGSGVGKSVLCAKLIGFNKAIGIEIVSSRHKQALYILSKLPKRLDHIKRNIEFYELNMFDYDFSEYKDKPVLVFASNLMWSEKTNKDFFKHISDNCAPGTIIISSMYNLYPEEKRKLQKVTTLHVPMSWDWQSNCFVFRVL